MDIEVFSFFAGLGFLDLGFQDAGFNIAFVNEYNKEFLRAYKYARRLHNNCPQYGYSHDDVREFLKDDYWGEKFPNYNQRTDKVIGFIGGPPCPDFSAAGKNMGSRGANGQLTNVYANLIVKRQPDFFLLENVKGLYQTKKHKEFYDLIKRRLYRAGYTLFDSIINGIEYGVPQFRERLVLVGFRRKTFGSHIKYKLGGQKKFNLEQVLALPWPQTNPFMENNEIICPNGIEPKLTIEYWFKKNNVSNHKNALDVFNVKSKERFLTIAEGDTTGKSFKRLHRWRFSPTAAYGNNEVHLHPYYPRRISVAEALAIQSLPEEFSLPIDLSLSEKFKMVGNGVPYLLSKGVALEIFEWVNEYIQIKGE